MTSDVLRQKFLDYFAQKNHKIISSSSLIPENDPSVLLTTAGMQQFKTYFRGEKDAKSDFGSLSLASSQKCFRTSDISEVGDSSHGTFFEMLGNFSLGGYGKKEAIKFAWDLLTNKEWFGLPKEKFFATIFSGDDQIPPDKQSLEFWKEVADDIEVREFGKDENFWPKPIWVGTCGPSSEIHWKINERESLEIWNLVFTQYIHTINGHFEDMGKINIDTGMGLERLAMIAQGKASVYETDLFTTVIKEIEKYLLPTQSYGSDQKVDRAMRIIADHIKSVTFAIADGVEPSNKERGYVIRRLIRRAVTQKYLWGEKNQPVSLLVDKVAKIYLDSYPYLKASKSRIKKIINKEEERFNKALDEGMQEWRRSSKKDQYLSKEVAFKLYESYGLPLEIMDELTGGRLDKAGFEELFEKHQDISRSGKL